MDFLDLLPDLRDLGGDPHFLLPLSGELIQPGLGGFFLSRKARKAFGVVASHELFPFEDLGFPVDLVDPPRSFFDCRRTGVEADGHAGAGRIEHTHRLVGKLPAGEIPSRQAHGIKQSLIGDHHFMMLLEKR